MEKSKNLQEAKRICDALNVPYREAVRGSSLTTISIGGPLFLIQPQSQNSLKDVLKELYTSGIDSKVVGGGSNLLISDEGLDIPVIQLGKGFKEFELKNGVWSVGAAVGLMQFSRNVSEAGFSGLEFAGGIPAWIGGAVFMNAGAHKGEISEVLESVEIFFQDGRCETITRSDLQMQYRSANLPLNTIVSRANFRLTEGDKLKSFELLKKNLEYRKKTQPLQLPSFGSVFKNPSKELSAGSVIESLGLKGKHIGGASISELHANWIVNQKKNALCKEVEELIACIISAANDSGVLLEPEVVRWRN